MTAKYPLIPYVPSQSEFKSPNTHNSLDKMITRFNSMCTAKIDAGASPTLLFADNVSSISRGSTGVYTVTLGISYDSADAFAVNVTAHHSAELISTVTSTTANTVVLRFTDDAGTLTDPTDFSIFTYGVQ